jgi:glycerophosphoryl diester phosphodiesterase
VAWPYPRIVAHRGGGALAPENTLAAIRLGAALGFRGVEFDVMLAGDGTPVVIHDETTERTTGVKGRVALMPYSQLEKLDAGNGEIIPRFQKAAALCRSRGLSRKPARLRRRPSHSNTRTTAQDVLTRSFIPGSLIPAVLLVLGIVL